MAHNNWLKIMVLLSLVLSCSSGLKNMPGADSGVVDLSSRDWEIEGSVDLDGSWKCFFSSDGLDSRQEAELIKPDFDDSSWELQPIIKSINKRNDYSDGVFYYRLKLVMNDAADMGIYFERAYTAYDLYINGEKILYAGKTAENKKDSIPQILPQLSEFKNKAELIIVIKMVNYKNPWINMTSAPRIGLYNDLVKERFHSFFIDFLVLGCLFITAAYHFFLWFRLRTDISNFVFSFLCIIIAVYLLVFNRHIFLLFQNSGVFLFQLAFKLQFILLFLLGLMLTFYFPSLFPHDFSKRILKIFRVAALFFILLIAVSSSDFNFQLLFIYMTFISVQNFWISFSLGRTMQRKRKNAVIIFCGFMILIISSLNDFLLEANVLKTIIALPTGMAVFIIIQSWILSNIFVTAFRKSRALGSELHSKVEKRSQQLLEKKEQLKSAFEKIKKTRKYQEDFFRSMSLQLRIPLFAILDPVRLFKTRYKTNIPQKAYELANIIERNSLQLGELIGQLYDLARIEKGEETINADQDDIISMIKDVISQFDGNGLSSRIHFSYRDNDLYKMLCFDSDKMGKVFRNLFSNALKFSDCKTPVTVSAEIVEYSDNRFNLNKAARISVMDSGQGIPEDKIPFIFERFYQVDGSVNRGREGLGIGLSLVKEYIEMHSGTVEVQSGSNGSTFVITLPLGLRDMQKHKNETSLNRFLSTVQNKEDEASVSSVPDITRGTILIVEDNSDLREYLKMNLENEYLVLQAENGTEGLKMLDNQKTDIILSDVMMPVMDGYKFREEVLNHETGRTVPFIFLTAKSEVSDQLKGLARGAVDYVTKPFKFPVLCKKIESLLQLSQLQKTREDNKIRKEIPGAADEKNSEPGRNEELYVKYNLSAREKDIAENLLKGLNNRAIGEVLYISTTTVNNHVSSVYAKCKVKNRAGLVKLFAEKQ